MAMRKFTFEDVHEWAMKAFPEHYKKLPKVDLQRHRRKCKGYRRKELDLSPYQLSIGKHATEYRIYAFWDNKEEEVLFLEGSERRPHGFLWGPNPGHKLCEPFSLICRSPLINDGSRVGDEMYKSELDSLIKFYFLAKGSPSSIVMDDQTLNSFKWSCRAIVNRDPGQEPPYCQSLLPELCCIADDRKKSNGALVPVFQTTPQTIVQALVICDSLGTPHANDTEKGRKRKASAMAEATSESRGKLYSARYVGLSDIPLVSHTRKETHMSLVSHTVIIRMSG